MDNRRSPVGEGLRFRLAPPLKLGLRPRAWLAAAGELNEPEEVMTGEEDGSERAILYAAAVEEEDCGEA